MDEIKTECNKEEKEERNKEERNKEVANDRLMLMHYMQTRSFFIPTPPIARTYSALQKCGYKMNEFSDDDVVEISKILREKSADSSAGCVTVMLIVFAIFASVVSNGLLIPVFAVFIFWQYRKSKKI